MSATELLEQVKALPPRERQRFFNQIHTLEEEAPSALGPGKAVRWPDAAARRKRIFGRKVLPNLVLMAREEERY